MSSDSQCLKFIQKNADEVCRDVRDRTSAAPSNPDLYSNTNTVLRMKATHGSG
jgi:hypothetical protein